MAGGADTPSVNSSPRLSSRRRPQAAELSSPLALEAPVPAGGEESCAMTYCAPEVPRVTATHSKVVRAPPLLKSSKFHKALFRKVGETRTISAQHRDYHLPMNGKIRCHYNFPKKWPLKSLHSNQISIGHFMELSIKSESEKR